MKSKWLIIIALIVMAVGFSISIYIVSIMAQKEALQNCYIVNFGISFEIEDMQLVPIEMISNISNPNDNMVEIDRLDFRIDNYNGIEGEGTLYERVVIPPHNIKEIIIPFKRYEKSRMKKTIVGLGDIILAVYKDTPLGAIKISTIEGKAT